MTNRMSDSFEGHRDKGALKCVCGFLDTQTERYNHHLECKPIHGNNIYTKDRFNHLYT